MPQPKDPSTNHPSLKIKQLLNLKTKALRSGVWFKTLQRIDRVLYDLTIRIVDDIRSPRLAKSMLALTEKLEKAVKSNFLRRLYEIGVPLAQQICSIGQKIGSLSAAEWQDDSSFIRFLAVLQINAGKVFNK
jgi:hypothetical protein